MTLEPISYTYPGVSSILRTCYVHLRYLRVQLFKLNISFTKCIRSTAVEIAVAEPKVMPILCFSPSLPAIFYLILASTFAKYIESLSPRLFSYLRGTYYLYPPIANSSARIP